MPESDSGNFGVHRARFLPDAEKKDIEIALKKMNESEVGLRLAELLFLAL